MVLCDTNVISNVCKFLNTNAPGKVSFNNSSGEVILETKKGCSVKGFASVMESIIRDQGKSQLGPVNAEELAQLRQWLEFCVTVVNFGDTQTAALKDLNERLSKVNFLVGNKISVADAVLFFIVYPVLAKASMQEKEQLCNLSRWFSTVQHHPAIQSSTSHKLIPFSRNPLYSY